MQGKATVGSLPLHVPLTAGSLSLRTAYPAQSEWNTAYPRHPTPTQGLYPYPPTSLPSHVTRTCSLGSVHFLCHIH